MNVSHSDVKNGKLGVAPRNWIRPSQSPGGGKMSEVVTSSNIFKWTWGTFIFELHWVGSTIQFDSCTRLRTQFTHLRTELTVEVVRDFIAVEKCRTQDIQLEAGNSQAPWGLYGVEKCRTQDGPSRLMWAFKQTWDLYFRPSLGQFCMTHPFSFRLHSVIGSACLGMN